MDINTRNLLWKRYFPKQSDGVCPICGTRHISFDDFDAAHIVPDGNDEIDNLVPTCRKCNDACKKKNLLIYKYETFPNIHSTISWIPSIKSLIIDISNKNILEEKIKYQESEIDNYKKLIIELEKYKILLEKVEKYQEIGMPSPTKIILSKKEIEKFLDPISGQKICDNTIPNKKRKSKIPISGYTYKGITHNSKYYKESLIFICNDLYEIHKDFSEKLKNKKYISKNKFKFHSYQIKNSDLYIMINLSTENIKKIIKELLTIFGYSEEIFKFDFDGTKVIT